MPPPDVTSLSATPTRRGLPSRCSRCGHLSGRPATCPGQTSGRGRPWWITWPARRRPTMLAGSGAVHVRQAVRSRLGVAPSRSGDGIGCPVRVAGRREPAKGEFFLLPAADLAAAGHRAAACPRLLVHRLAVAADRRDASARTARLLNQADSAVATVSGRVSRRTRRRQGDGPPAGRIVPLSTRPGPGGPGRGSKTSCATPAHSRSSQLIKPWRSLGQWQA